MLSKRIKTLGLAALLSVSAISGVTIASHISPSYVEAVGSKVEIKAIIDIASKEMSLTRTDGNDISFPYRYPFSVSISAPDTTPSGKGYYIDIRLNSDKGFFTMNTFIKASYTCSKENTNLDNHQFNVGNYMFTNDHLEIDQNDKRIIHTKDISGSNVTNISVFYPLDQSVTRVELTYGCYNN